jgi:exopolysaccharide production protein ExoQ
MLMSSTVALNSQVAPVSMMGAPQCTGFFFASRICITLLAFQSAPVAGTATSIAGSFLLLFLACLVGTKAQPRLQLDATMKWLCAYLALVGLSLFWSVTGSSAIAIAYWSTLLADCLTVYWLTRGADQDVCNGIMRGFIAGAAVAGAIAWVLPTLPDLRIGNEDFLHPNALGYTLAIATLFGLYQARNSRWVALLTAFCGATLLRTLSKASIAGFVAAAAFYLLRGSHLGRRAKVAIGILAAALIASSWGLLETYANTYDQSTNVETLTGRTYIWAVAWEEAWKTPILGHGFYSFRFVIPVLGTFEPWQAHNELLQQFFCYGAVGLTIFAGLYLMVIRTIRRTPNRELATLAAAIMLFALVRGLVDTERFDINFSLWLITLFAVALSTTCKELA